MLFHSTGKQEELIRRCDECLVAHRHRLLACAYHNADAHTDVDLLLADTVRRVARIFCRRQMSEEVLLRYTLRSIRNAARHERLKNRQRYDAECGFGQAEALHHRQPLPTEGEGVPLHQRLTEVLRLLPEPHAAVLRMKLWEELPFTAIAERAGVSESTVRRQYEAAIGMIRKRLKQP